MKLILSTAKGRHRRRRTAGIAASVVVIGGLATGVAGAVASSSPASAAMQPCSPSFIGVPGSGESNTHSPTISAVLATVNADAAKAGVQLRNSTLLPYPAVPPSQYVTLSSININNLGKSEASGESNLMALITAYRAASTAAGCPGAPILLAGYSQGAEVVIRTVDALPLAVRNTITIALLGNPSFKPGLSQDFDLSSTAYQGVRPSLLDGQRYNLKSDVISRTIDLCAASDPICAYHISLVPALLTGTSAHLHYPTLTFSGLKLTVIAANYLWSHRATASPTPPAPRPPTPVSSAPVSSPPAAPAAYHTGRQVSIAPNATSGVSGHTGPGNQYAGGPSHPANSALWIVCHENGQTITNSYYNDTTPIWDLSDDGYWYSDAWLHTGTNGAAVPPCALRTVKIAANATTGVSGHTGPGNQYAAGPTYPANASITIACHVNGQTITNSYYNDTTPIWDLATDGHYYSDAWLYTGTNGAAVPPC
jgi:uncharacterized protein YraI